VADVAAPEKLLPTLIGARGGHILVERVSQRLMARCSPDIFEVSPLRESEDLTRSRRGESRFAGDLSATACSIIWIGTVEPLGATAPGHRGSVEVGGLHEVRSRIAVPAGT